MIDFEEQFLEKIREVVREEFARITNIPQLSGGLSQKDNLTPTEAGEAIGIKTSTLAVWRSQGIGPAYSKCGRLIRYRRQDLEGFLESRTVAR